MDEKPKKPPIDRPDTLANPYEVLGLTRPAAPEDIRAAYFAKVKEHPPERDPQAFKRVRAAYEALRTPEAKAATDLFLLQYPPEYEPYRRPPAFNLDLNPTERLRVIRANTDLGRLDFRDDYRDVEL
jgi:curved DNA-binding protein CbpA